MQSDSSGPKTEVETPASAAGSTVMSTSVATHGKHEPLERVDGDKTLQSTLVSTIMIVPLTEEP